MKVRGKIIERIIYFIRERHVGNIVEATKHQAWLKKRLRNSFTSVLLRNGNPDTDYLDVIQRWFEEERAALEK
jgi:hypothetical protein